VNVAEADVGFGFVAIDARTTCAPELRCPDRGCNPDLVALHVPT